MKFRLYACTLSLGKKRSTAHKGVSSNVPNAYTLIQTDVLLRSMCTGPPIYQQFS